MPISKPCARCIMYAPEIGLVTWEALDFCVVMVLCSTNDILCAKITKEYVARNLKNTTGIPLLGDFGVMVKRMFSFFFFKFDSFIKKIAENWRLLVKIKHLNVLFRKNKLCFTFSVRLYKITCNRFAFEAK